MDMTLLEETVRHQESERAAATALSVARGRLAISLDPGRVFFAHIALHLAPCADWTLPTAATAGRRLIYNPDFIGSLSMAAVEGLLIHEVMHVANRHHCRRARRPMPRWNLACDLAINPMIRDAGLLLPAEGVWPGDINLPDGLSAEDYYSRLPEGVAAGDDPGGCDGCGGGAGDDPGGCGGVIDAPGDQAAAECEAQMLVAQAERAARHRGELPAALARLCNAVLRPAVPWQAELAEFLRASARTDYSWRKPNRRAMAQGIHLPGLYAPSLGDIVIAIDTSGSIGTDDLARFGAEVYGALLPYHCTAHILWCDARIHRVEEWTPVDGHPDLAGAPGGGGTDHRPIWDWIAGEDLTPSVAICLTDLETEHGEEPPYPVLWVSTGRDSAPFGRVVRI